MVLLIFKIVKIIMYDRENVSRINYCFIPYLLDIFILGFVKIFFMGYNDYYAIL